MLKESWTTNGRTCAFFTGQKKDLKPTAVNVSSDGKYIQTGINIYKPKVSKIDPASVFMSEMANTELDPVFIVPNQLLALERSLFLLASQM